MNQEMQSTLYLIKETMKFKPPQAIQMCIVIKDLLLNECISVLLEIKYLKFLNCQVQASLATFDMNLTESDTMNLDVVELF